MTEQHEYRSAVPRTFVLDCSCQELSKHCNFGCYNQLQKYLRHCTIFWLKWPVHDLVLLTPPSTPKLPALQDHAQNLEEQL